MYFTHYLYCVPEVTCQIQKMYVQVFCELYKFKMTQMNIGNGFQKSKDSSNSQGITIGPLVLKRG